MGIEAMTAQKPDRLSPELIAQATGIVEQIYEEAFSLTPDGWHPEDAVRVVAQHIEQRESELSTLRAQLSGLREALAAYRQNCDCYVRDNFDGSKRVSPCPRCLNAVAALAVTGYTACGCADRLGDAPAEPTQETE
jgi:hypothetical protein